MSISFFKRIMSMRYRKEKEVMEESKDGYVVPNDKVYVALGENVEHDRSILLWALQNSGGKRFCAIHVRQPIKRNQWVCSNSLYPLRSATSFTSSGVWTTSSVDREKGGTSRVANEYRSIAKSVGVDLEILFIEADSIEKGIIRLIYRNNIEKLVMGTVVDHQRMSKVKSTLLRYILQHAPPYCQIWFVRGGCLINIREKLKLASIDGETMQNPLLLVDVALLLEMIENFPIQYKEKHNLESLKDLLASIYMDIQGGKSFGHHLREIKNAIYRAINIFEMPKKVKEHHIYSDYDFLGHDEYSEHDCLELVNCFSGLLASSSEYISGKKQSDEMLASSLSIGLVKYSPEWLYKISSEKTEPSLLRKAPNIEHLPSYLVPCLAYCSLYPKGHKFVREILVNQWMAENFLFSYTDEVAEDIRNSYFDELLSRGVFQNPVVDVGGKVYSCEIHPLAHDAACRIAGKDVAVIDSFADHTDASYISLNIDDYSIRYSYKEVELCESMRTCIFLGNSAAQLIDNRWFARQNFMHLRVLDLCRLQFEELPFYNELRQLRYLGLSGNHILKWLHIDIPACLQTLAVDGCIQLELLENFTHVRNLYFTTKQRTLYLDSFNLQILEISHCTELRCISGFDHTKHLRRLRIFDCPRLVTFPKFVNSNHLEELIFHNCTRLDLSKGLKNLFRLRYLEVVGLPKLETLPLGLQSATSLEHFIIADCKSLKSTGSVLHYLKSLKKFCIYNCPNLLTLQICAPNLRSLDIRRCPILIQNCSSDKGKDWAAISHIPEIILGGQCLRSQKSDDRASDSLQHGVQGDIHLPESVPYFNLKSKIFKTVCVSMTYSRWRILALVIKATARFRVMLKEAYKSLEEMKLFCRLFPNDYYFERETLIQLWMAAGYIMSRCKEDVGNSYFDILLAEEYILSSRIDIMTRKSWYKVNVEKVRILFDGRSAIEDKDRYTVIEDQFMKGDVSKPEHISIVSKYLDPTTLEILKTFRELKTVLFVRDYGCSLKQVPSGMFSTPQSIQALDLSGSHVTELPDLFENMGNLSFLDLSFTLIEKLPESICCLLKLQTLRLKGCKQLCALPEAMKDLRSLRHLEFDVLSQLTFMPKEIGALTELRTLSAFIVGTEKGCEMNELENLDNLRGSLCISGLERVSHMDDYTYLVHRKRLTHLELRWSEFKSSNQSLACKILKSLEPPSCIEELHILCYPGSEFPKWIGNYYENLVRITLFNCESTSLNITLGELPNLEFLSIIQMNKLSAICEDMIRIPYTTAAVGFPKLKQLEMDGMRSLESWTGVKSSDFPLLAKFTMMQSPKLTELPFLPMLPSLKFLEISSCKVLTFTEGRLPDSVESLIIDECPLLKTRCSKGREDWHKIKHVPHIWIDQIDYSPHEDSATEDENWITDSQSEYDESESCNDLNEAYNENSAEEQKRDRKNDVRDKFKGKLEALCLPDEEIEYYLESHEDMILFCLIFSHDYDFDEETLIQLWVARGFIKNEHTNHMIGHLYFQILLSAAYIVPTGTCITSKKEKYKANVDMLEDDLASLTLFDNPSIQLKNVLCHKSSKGDLHVSLASEDNDELLSKIFDNLKALFLCKNASRINKIPKDVFNALKLEVLHLGGTRIKELPSSIKNLVELRYLDLSCTRIKELPDDVNVLSKLQTLKLNNCERLFRLTEKMSRLTSLEHLELDVLSQLATMPRGMGALTKLETLSAFIVHDEDGRRIEELKNMDHLKGTFCISGLEHVSDPRKAKEAFMREKECIKELELRWSDNHETWDKKSSDHHEILQSLHPNSNLEQLRISCYGGEIFPHWISVPSLNMLTTIRLYKCANAKKLPSLGQLPSLKFLSLMEMIGVEKIGSEFRGVAIPVAFPKLEKLEIIGFSKLYSWENETTENAYPQLCKLVIELCPLLTEVPSSLLSTTSLKTLIVDECPLVTEEFQGGQPKNWLSIKHVEDVWINQEKIIRDD